MEIKPSEQAMQVQVHGIQCDNEHCDFIDMSVRREDYDQWLNKPCPKCLHILLTQEDLDSIEMMLELADLLNDACSDMDLSDEPQVECKVKMCGDGSMEFGEMKEVTNE